MENGKELIYQAVGVFLFCLAISLLMRQASIYMKLLNIIDDTYKDSDALYQNEYTNLDEISYEELITSLFGPLEYDLEINDLLISKYDHTTDKIESYNIAVSSYTKSYYYDSNGSVTRIIYKSR